MNFLREACQHLHYFSAIMLESYLSLVDFDDYLKSETNFREIVCKSRDFLKAKELKETLAYQKSIVESKSFFKN